MSVFLLYNVIMIIIIHIHISLDLEGVNMLDLDDYIIGNVN